MKKLLITALLFLGLFSINFGQYTSEESDTKENSLSKLTFQDRLYTGGNLAFNVNYYYGTPITYFEASPYIGYKMTEKFSVGVGMKYIYLGSKQANFTYSVFGGNIFSRYKFTENLFAHTELEILRAYNLNPNSSDYGKRATAPIFFVGAGYGYSLGGSVTIQIMLLYDLINNINSPYQSSYLFGSTGLPIVYRFGVNIGM